MKLRMNAGLSCGDVVGVINAFEDKPAPPP
jgi:hypothetical protein